jgi:hypothetical protein
MNPSSSVQAGCHCGNITADLHFSNPTENYSRRACDCDFCTKHGASYVSDPLGNVRAKIKQREALALYRQGSGTAVFHICKNCGILVFVTYEANGKTFVAVNSRSVNGVQFGELTTVHPQSLSADEKTKRWSQVWFSNVKIEI